MDITFLGHSSFKIKTKQATVICDPYEDTMVGFKFPKQEADLVTISHFHQDHSELKNVLGEPFIISVSGEYEIKGVSVFGIPTYHDNEEGKVKGKNTCYLIEAEGVRICHLGDLGHQLTDKQIEEIDGVDVLIIPVGGSVTIDAKGAAAIVSKIEPRFVIPMHYQEEGLNKEVFGDLAPLETFLKEMGSEATPEPKLTVTREALPEERRVVVLERKA